MRTARICFLTAAINLGWLVGAPVGTRIKAAHGYVTLFSMNTILLVMVLIFVVIFLKESVDLVSDERRLEIIQDKENDIKCDKGKQNNITYNLTMSSYIYSVTNFSSYPNSCMISFSKLSSLGLVTSTKTMHHTILALTPAVNNI